MLSDFCRANRVKEAEISCILERYTHLETYVEEHNEHYVSKMLAQEKDYLDNILKEVDPNVILDKDQRKVVLTDEDYSLVIAGAGAGENNHSCSESKIFG